MTIIGAALGLALLLPQPTLAGQPVDPSTLNPVPPDFYTCMATGGGTVCQGDRIEVNDPAPTDVSCPGFPIFDQSILHQHATRFYDRDLNLTRRIIHERWLDASWSNPLSGRRAPYAQTDNIVSDLTVPGDLGTAIESMTGETIVRTESGNKVLVGTGRVVINDADGSLVSSAGKQWTVDLFFLNDRTVLDAVCAALA
jgi:hypothetical protein